MKKLLLPLLMMLLPLMAMAVEIEIGGIYYNLNSSDKTAEVTSQELYQSSYSGSVVIPSSVTYSDVTYDVTSIGPWAFYRCSELTSIEIPNSVTILDHDAFYGCSGLASVEIPNSVKIIGFQAFHGCSGLTTVKIPNSVIAIYLSAFTGCSGLTSVEIPNSVIAIGGGVFDGCSKLSSIEIPNSITKIHYYTFSRCTSLALIEIPNSVASIEVYAFEGCTGVTDVYCWAEDVPVTGNDVFLNASIASATLHVLESSIEAYKTTAPWSGFGKIVPIDVTEIRGVDATKEGRKAVEIFTHDGKPQNQLQKGINIVKYSDGTTKKVIY